MAEPSKKPLNFADAMRLKPLAANLSPSHNSDISPATDDKMPTADDMATKSHDLSQIPATMSPTESHQVSEPQSHIVTKPSISSLNTRVENQWQSRRDETRVHARIPEWKNDCLLELMRILRCPKEAIIEEAIDLVIQKYLGDMSQSQNVTLSPNHQVTTSPSRQHNYNNHDNELLFLYKTLTGANIRKSDRRAFQDIAHYPKVIIECGIRLAKQRADAAGNIIYSFNYCARAVEEVANYAAGFNHELFLMQLKTPK